MCVCVCVCVVWCGVVWCVCVCVCVALTEYMWLQPAPLPVPWWTPARTTSPTALPTIPPPVPTSSDGPRTTVPDTAVSAPVSNSLGHFGTLMWFLHVTCMCGMPRYHGCFTLYSHSLLSASAWCFYYLCTLISLLSVSFCLSVCLPVSPPPPPQKKTKKKKKKQSNTANQAVIKLLIIFLR